MTSTFVRGDATATVDIELTRAITSIELSVFMTTKVDIEMREVSAVN